MNLQRVFLTFFYIGYAPKYTKDIAIVVASIVGMITLYSMGEETLSMLILASSIISIFEIKKYLQSSEDSDLDNIVIDVVIGIWLTLLSAYSTIPMLSYPYATEIAIVVAMVTFYAIDRWKPSTIGWLYYHIQGGLGIIGSAILSGIASGFMTIAILKLIDILIKA
jgi:phosphatidylglycerophosphatase A